MKFQKKIMVIALAIPFLIFSIQTIPHAWPAVTHVAKADDDEHEGYKEHDDDEHDDYKKKDHDDDDDDKYKEKSTKTYTTQPTNQNPTWNVWTRTVGSSKNGDTPFATEKMVSLYDGIKENTSVKAFPKNGQIYVPIEKTAPFLDAHVIRYPKKEFVEVIKNGDTIKQLTFKRDTLASYENGQKVPLPEPMIEKDGEFWIPVSVLANGLGYQVNYSNDTLLFQIERR